MAKDMSNNDIVAYEGGDYGEIMDNYDLHEITAAIANRAGKAADTVRSLEQEIEEMKNNPDVVDIVATYADLQAYDTSKLGDNDIIRVLADETHDGDSAYYRYSKSSGTWTYIASVPSGGGTYTAGANINITEENVISATYTAGDGIDITNGVISAVSGGDDDTKYAELDYYSVWTKTYRWYGEDWGSPSAELTSVDVEKYSAWCEANPFWANCRDWSYRLGQWNTYTDDGDISIPGDEMYETTGLNFTLYSSEAYGQVCPVLEVDTTSEIKRVNIIGKNQWDSLGSSDSSGDITGLGEDKDVTVNRQAIYALWINHYVETPYAPDYFLYSCKNLTRTGYAYNHYPGSLPLSSCGSYCLANCSSLIGNPDNQSFSIDFSGIADETGKRVTKVGDYLLNNVFPNGSTQSTWNSFRLAFSGSGSEVTIGDYCFSDNGRFNGVIELYAIFDTMNPANSIKSIDIGNNFAENCLVSEVTFDGFNAVLTSVGDKFLNCGALQSIRPNGLGVSYLTFTSLKTIGDKFMSSTGSYNGNYSIYFPVLEEVGIDFLSESTFNAQLSFSSLKKVGSGFLTENTTFTQTLEFPALTNLNGSSFLYNCKSFTGPLILGKPDLVVDDGGTYTLSTDDSSAAMFTTGVSIQGLGRSRLLSLGDNTYASPYRKMIDAGGETLAIIGTADPTTSTVGLMGQLYTNNTTGDTFQCTSTSGGIYTWTKRWVI